MWIKQWLRTLGTVTYFDTCLMIEILVAGGWYPFQVQKTSYKKQTNGKQNNKRFQFLCLMACQLSWVI